MAEAQVLSELFVILSSFLDKGLVTWIPVIMVAGLLYKKVIKLQGYALPFAIYLTSFVIALVNGIFVEYYHNFIQLLGYAAGQAILCAFFSMGLYDILKAFKGVISKLADKISSGKKDDAEEKEVSVEVKN